MDNPSPQPKPAGHAPNVISLPGILVSLMILILMIAAVFVTAKITYRALEKKVALGNHRINPREVTPSVAASRPFFPQPREQVMPKEELRALRARETGDLTSYGWVNPSAGIVRIPIDRAMDLISQRGLPYHSETNLDDDGPSNLQLQQSRAAESNSTPRMPR